MNIFDLLCTNKWIQLYGLEIEANPIGRFLYDINFVMFFKIAIIGLLLIFLCEQSYKHYYARLGLFIIFGVYVALTIFHIIIIVTHSMII